MGMLYEREINLNPLSVIVELLKGAIEVGD
jgi:hypothetical protein